MPAVNWFAVLAATLSMFVLGALWYSPLLFVKPWIKAAGLDVDVEKRGNFAVILGASFVLTLIMAPTSPFSLRRLPTSGRSSGTRSQRGWAGRRWACG
jgi:hypothetical protein